MSIFKLQRWQTFVNKQAATVLVGATDAPDSLADVTGTFQIFDPSNTYPKRSIVIVTAEMANYITTTFGFAVQSGIYGANLDFPGGVSAATCPNIPQNKWWDFLCFLPESIKECEALAPIYVQATQPQ